MPFCIRKQDVDFKNPLSFSAGYDLLQFPHHSDYCLFIYFLPPLFSPGVKKIVYCMLKGDVGQLSATTIVIKLSAVQHRHAHLCPLVFCLAAAA